MPSSKPSSPTSLVATLKILSRDKRTWTYLLGLAGWIVVIMNMPFDWTLPAYAEF